LSQVRCAGGKFSTNQRFAASLLATGGKALSTPSTRSRGLAVASIDGRGTAEATRGTGRGTTGMRGAAGISGKRGGGWLLGGGAKDSR